jgi:hypothetical protein
MRNAALVIDDEYEVPVSSIEVLEANVAAIRDNLSEFKSETRASFASLNAEIKSLREKADRNFERLFTKFEGDIKETNKALSQLGEAVLKIDSRQSAIIWMGGGLIALITVAVTLGKALKWF